MSMILTLLFVYLAAGALTALAFVSFGASRLLPGHPPISIGARLLLMPASILLWPLIVKRWLGARAAS
jgi:hypothetical protein